VGRFDEKIEDAVIYHLNSGGKSIIFGAGQNFTKGFARFSTMLDVESFGTTKAFPKVNK